MWACEQGCGRGPRLGWGVGARCWLPAAPGGWGPFSFAPLKSQMDLFAALGDRIPDPGPAPGQFLISGRQGAIRAPARGQTPSLTQQRMTE